MNKIEEISDFIDRIFIIIGKIGIIVIIAMGLTVVFDVAGRFFFNLPIVGSTEIVQILNLILSVVALVWCTLSKEHIRVSLLDRVIPKKVKAVSDNIYYVAGAFFFLLICVQNMKLSIKSAASNAKTVVLGIPFSPIYFAIAFCCACVVILLLTATIKNILLASRRNGNQFEP